MRKHGQFHFGYLGDWVKDVAPSTHEIEDYINKNYDSIITTRTKQSSKQQKKIPNTGNDLDIILCFSFDISVRSEKKIIGGAKIKKYSFIIYFDMRPDLSSYPKIYEISGKLHQAFDTIEYLDDILNEMGIKKKV